MLSCLCRQYDRDFYADGMLPSFPGAPRFAHQSAMKTMHNMGDAIYKLRKMAHSTKVKLQAARLVGELVATSQKIRIIFLSLFTS